MKEGVPRPVGHTAAPVRLAALPELQALASESALVDPPVLCAAEWHAKVLQLETWAKVLQDSVLYRDLHLDQRCSTPVSAGICVRLGLHSGCKFDQAFKPSSRRHGSPSASALSKEKWYGQRSACYFVQMSERAVKRHKWNEGPSSVETKIKPDTQSHCSFLSTLTTSECLFLINSLYCQSAGWTVKIGLWQ